MTKQEAEMLVIIERMVGWWRNEFGHERGGLTPAFIAGTLATMEIPNPVERKPGEDVNAYAYRIAAFISGMAKSGLLMGCICRLVKTYVINGVSDNTFYRLKTPIRQVKDGLFSREFYRPAIGYRWAAAGSEASKFMKFVAGKLKEKK